MNPFVLRPYYDEALFCDRKEETRKIIHKFNNQTHITLTAHRKMGKTGLLYHVFSEIKKQDPDVVCLYVDLYFTQSIQDFIDTFGKILIKNITRKSENTFKVVSNVFKSVRPTVTFDAGTGEPRLEFGIKTDQEHLQSVSDIFDYLANCGKRVWIAFDEFQQITQYPQPQMEALLRTHLQQAHNIHCIFSGSHLHLIHEMFSSVKRPFYQSTDSIFLKEIPHEAYIPFIIRLFAMGKRQIDEETVKEILRLTRTHTYYVQNLCNKLYGSGIKKLEIKQVQETLEAMLDEKEEYYLNYHEMLPEYQWKLLVAIANETEGAQNLFSKSFTEKYGLNTQGTIQKALQGVLDKELIFEKDGKYWVQDVFFSRWLEKRKI